MENSLGNSDGVTYVEASLWDYLVLNFLNTYKELVIKSAS